MVIDMNISRLGTIEQIRNFLNGTGEVPFSNLSDELTLRTFVTTVIKRFGYYTLPKGERGVLFAYMRRMTGYSRQHLSRLVTQYRDTKTIKPGKRVSSTSFGHIYGPEHVALLAEIDALHDTLSGPATKVLMIRAATIFGDSRYAWLSDISVSHLYNLRASNAYRKHRLICQRTRPTPSSIAIRKAPAPHGLPGYIRIDTVHQGDQDGVKGVYHINAVDIVTQWELMASVEHISEAFLQPVITMLLDGFPFVIRGFHSDSGSEYLNHETAKLLEKMRIEFTRSRPRHTNDNALAECKNGAVIRKAMGHNHIAQIHAGAINQFYKEVFNPYVNFHRPCYFSVDKIDAKGKIRKTYPHNQIMTPWDRLKSVPAFEKNLKSDVTSESLERQANAMSDNEAAKQMQKAKKRLFQSINRYAKA